MTLVAFCDHCILASTDALSSTSSLTAATCPLDAARFDAGLLHLNADSWPESLKLRPRLRSELVRAPAALYNASQTNRSGWVQFTSLIIAAEPRLALALSAYDDN